MQACEQTPGQSVWEHGESVRAYLLDLISPEPQLEWRLPDWLIQHKSDIISRIHSLDILEQYTLYHDCGKPRCLTIDAEGRSHFPDHARISREVYIEHFPADPTNHHSTVADLIGWDMVVHTVTAKELDHYLRNEWSERDAFSLLLTAFAEVHSNAAMFGGISSTSFKIKWKRICKRGKQILRFYGLI